jgi:hypothetical protein
MTVEIKTPADARLPKPESLEAKFKLMARLPYDERARRKHNLVLGFILDWYHSKYGNALASVRHVVDHIKERDPSKKGLSIPHVHAALADLVEWGYLQQDKGAGKRASRYIPAWGLVCSSPIVTPVGNASGSGPSVTPGVNTTVTPGVNAKADSVIPVGNKDPSTLTRSQDPGTGVEDTDDSAAPLAPRADALSGPAAGPAEEFEILYRAYGIRRNKAAAEAEFMKLNLPIADLIAAAKAWKAAAGDGIDRMYLDRWLREKRYDEDPPTKYEPKPGKVKMPRKQAGAVRRDAAIDEILLDGAAARVVLRWNDSQDGEPSHSTLSRDGKNLASLMRDLGVSCASDIEYRRVLIDFNTARDGTETERWHRYPDVANDNLPRATDIDDTIRDLPWEEAA